MSPQILFNIQLVLGYVAWLLCFRVYLWPKLSSMAPLDAQRAIATLHSFRFFGLVFILPGVIGPKLPGSFAAFAAYWDLATGVLAMLALLTVGARPVVLVNSDVLDKLEVASLPSIPVRHSLFSLLRVLLCLVPKPCRLAIGNPRPSSSTRRSAALREAAETHPSRSIPVGLAPRGLERLAVQSLPRATGDRDRLAPEGLSSLLAVEDSVGKTGKARRAAGDPPFDSHSEP
jgi:hypothetical protein